MKKNAGPMTTAPTAPDKSTIAKATFEPKKQEAYLPGKTGKGRTKRSGSLSWNDVFARPEGCGALPTRRSSDDAITLGDAITLDETLEKKQKTPPPSTHKILNQNLLNSGPFEIPEDSTRKQHPAHQGKGMKILTAFLGILWGISIWLPYRTFDSDESKTFSSSNQAKEELRSLLNAGDAYLRFDVSSLRASHVQWLGQIGHALVARVDPAWKDLPPEDKVRVMKDMYTAGIAANRLLVLGPNSKKWGEITNQVYKIHP